MAEPMSRRRSRAHTGADPFFDVRGREECRENYYDGIDSKSPAPKVRVADREPAIRVMAGVNLGCWCGQSYGHDWPGKSEGAPHPR